jgi:hypothetical protein
VTRQPVRKDVHEGIGAGSCRGQRVTPVGHTEVGRAGLELSPDEVTAITKNA